MARLLLLDDDEHLLDVLALAFEDKGHDVHTAPDGAAGWALLADIHPDGAPTPEVRLWLLRPLSESVQLDGATLLDDRQTLVFRLHDLPYDARRRRHRMLTLHTTQPLVDQQQAMGLPLSGAPVERVTTDGFTLDVAAVVGVEHGVRRDTMPGVTRDLRRDLERHTEGATPLGALYLSPSPPLRKHGLLATVVDGRSAQTALGFGLIGAGVVFAFAAGAWWLRRYAARERAEAVLDADLDEVARWQGVRT